MQNPVCPRNTTCTAAKLKIDKPFVMIKQAHATTYAVVAANTSVLRAFATVARVRENTAVKIIVTASRASGFLTKYRTSMDVVGSRDERTVLIEFAMTSRRASS